MLDAQRRRPRLGPARVAGVLPAASPSPPHPLRGPNCKTHCCRQPAGSGTKSAFSTPRSSTRPDCTNTVKHTPQIVINYTKKTRMEKIHAVHLREEVPIPQRGNLRTPPRVLPAIDFKFKFLFRCKYSYRKGKRFLSLINRGPRRYYTHRSLCLQSLI